LDVFIRFLPFALIKLNFPALLQIRPSTLIRRRTGWSPFAIVVGAVLFLDTSF
jgi:hypothetical protein